MGDKLMFPDSVIDFKVDPDDPEGQYLWVIELQCNQVGIGSLSHVAFVGINFYSKKQNPDQAYIDEMLNAARAQGIGMYMDGGLGLYMVPQTGCNYTEVDQAESPAVDLTKEYAQRIHGKKIQ